MTFDASLQARLVEHTRPFSHLTLWGPFEKLHDSTFDPKIRFLYKQKKKKVVRNFPNLNPLHTDL